MDQSASADATLPATPPAPLFDASNRPMVQALTPAVMPSALATLAHAFHDDPGAIHLFPQAGERHFGMTQLFALGLNYGRRYGCVDVLHHGGAVAVWIPPEFSTPSWRRLLGAGFLTAALRLGRAVGRTLRFKHFLEARRRELVRQPHWYLFCIGVHPDQQGRGLGATLLQHGLARARASGAACYLETVNAGNLAFYRAHGFHEIGQKQLPPAGPDVWSLWRTPAGQ